MLKLMDSSIYPSEDKQQCIVFCGLVEVAMTIRHESRQMISLFSGTGTNCCYLEDLEKVELWKGDLDEPKKVALNFTIKFQN